MKWFTAGAIAIAAAGMVVGALPPLAPDLAARLLRFYWFRLSDAVVPLMFALLVMRLIVDGAAAGHYREILSRNALASGSLGSRLTKPWVNAPRLKGTIAEANDETVPGVEAVEQEFPPPEALADRWKRQVGILLLMIATALFAKASYQDSQLGVPPSVSNILLGWDTDATPDVQKQVYDDWRAVCRWARISSDEDEVFLTPRHQQTFKWYADRAEVVNWKDVPQDAVSLREWYRRFREVFPRRLGTLRVTIQYDQLRKLGEEYGARYLIVDRRVAGENLPLIQVYPSEFETNATFAVYRLPYRSDPPNSKR
jgi:hypothetical protein